MRRDYRAGAGATGLDARGVISVTERAAFIGRVRALARSCCETWLSGSPDNG
jgi:glycyl-tRNA synthetase alpha chain